MKGHAVLNRINPTGQTGVWRCTRCKAKGTLAELGSVICSDPSPATDRELLDAIVGKKSR